MKDDVVERMQKRLDTIERLYHRGHYEEAAMRNVLEKPLDTFPAALQARYWRYCAWIETRRGYLSGMNLLAQAESTEHDMHYFYDRLTVARFQGLAVPTSQTQAWLEQIESFMRHCPSRSAALDCAYLEHKGAYELRCNRLQDALAAFTKAEAFADLKDSIRGRCAALLAETYRRLDMPELARRSLARALRCQRANRIEGDMADFTFCIRAKLAADEPDALRWLHRAKAIQHWLRNYVGLTRALLLEARIGKNTAETGPLKTQISSLAEHFPAIHVCEVYQRILRNWGKWVNDKHSTDEYGDRFWGL